MTLKQEKGNLPTHNYSIPLYGGSIDLFQENNDNNVMWLLSLCEIEDHMQQSSVIENLFS